MVSEFSPSAERRHGTVELLVWPACRPIAICPWCHGDTKSHAAGCWVPAREECRTSERELRVGLRKHELEALGYFFVLGKSRDEGHFWLRCQTSECGMLFHVRKPGPFETDGYFVHAKPIESDLPIGHCAAGLAAADWASLWNHARIHGAGGAW